MAVTNIDVGEGRIRQRALLKKKKKKSQKTNSTTG